MNILQIIPGSGGSFYCGNCLRDDKFHLAMKKQGHEVTKIPMYLPLFSDEHDLNEIPVFYGAISIYLKQLYPIFRHAPAWVDRLLNSGPMLKLAASMAGSTSAKGLEEMTISMLMGEKGKQKDELNRMVSWVSEYLQPDVIHISNALLLGLAPRLKKEFPNAIIICSLQDEEVWVDAMNDSFRDKIWALMSTKAEDIDAFIAVSDFYAQVSIKKMKLPKEKVFTNYLGVDPEEYRYVAVNTKERNIGYISRMCEANGFDIMVDAFIHLKKDKAVDDVKLILTGGSTGEDKALIKQLRQKLREANLTDQVEFHEDFDGEGRHDFFSKVKIISVPVRNGEAFGLYLLESMASGVPVVQPKLGAFPEIVEKSNGGIIYENNTPEVLATAIKDLLNQEDKLQELSTSARKGVEEEFNIYTQSDKLIGIYSKFLKITSP
ncbi:glycosyltransferase family 1 protein [Ancylomarina euxinus]|uniref:Glycosyltransferase family 1 protein n=1 Tax=Ancylomarina euxinus TaxID=2283627 RepID=A0A425XZU1_9BACT|nr:glycosyltransferase family 4 protein [Ancylomarina euxinus]MCZ4695414.1 glycosyltransferase family 4 protein [Ancylomarina euxinus]MUP15610.1 glycosyltransferase [Ancylomarina euxinus]RRG20950.1 glycosyltransferase family 1 protein [Ancylomarina euxinus]